jgi:capsular polysaccharide biosynthesis protein
VFLAEDTAIDPNIVTPGVVGFVATIFVAVVTILLLWDMVRRIRRQRYQAEIEAKLDAEQAAARKK